MRALPASLNRLQPLLLLSPAFLAMAWLVSRAQWFWSNNPDLQFGWVVLLLCGYLFYEAWEKCPAVDWQVRAWAVAIAVPGLVFLFWVQIYEASLGVNAASTVGLALGVMTVVVANLSFVFGWRGLRVFGMSFAFILIAMPMPSAVQGPIINGLQDKVAWVNTEVLNLLGIPATQVGSLIHLPSGTVGVDEACSGIRSLQSTIMATIFIGYLTLRRFSLQVLLLGCGMALAILGNLVRSLYLSLTANAKGVEAIEGVHDAAGWSILAFTAVGVIIISWFFSKIERRVAALEAPETPLPEADAAAAPGSSPP